MFCTKCGNKIPDGSAFCDQCGAMVENAQPQMIPPAQPYNNGYRQDTPAAPAPKKMSQKTMILCAAAVVVVIAVIIIVKSIKPTLNLNDYLTVSFEGYNTRGNAVVNFDMDAFKAAYEDKIKYQGVVDDDLRRYLKNGGSFCEYMYDECVEGALDKYSMLSTGDTVTYTWTCDEELAETQFNVKLSYENLELTVSDLTPVTEVDPFEDIEIQYTGIAPYGSVSNIVNNSKNQYLQNMYYYCNTSGYLNNGDEITVVAESYDSEEYYLNNYGIVFTRMENTYTVDGLGGYVSALDQITEDSMNSMKSQAEDGLRAYVANRWEAEEVLDGMEYLGSYLLTPKAKENGSTQNQLILVYKISARDNLTEYGVSDQFNYYYTTTFNNLIIMPDGTVSVDLTNYSTPSDQFYRKVYYGDRSYDYYTYYYNGYETFDTMFNKNVTSRIDKYNYESNVTQK